MRILLLLLSTLCWSVVSYGQDQATIDSLNTLIEKSGQSKQGADALLDLSEVYRFYNPSKSDELAGKASTMASKIGYDKGVAEAHVAQGVIRMMNVDNERALSHFKEALNYFETVNDEKRATRMLSNIAYCYYLVGDYTNAKDEWIKALKRYEKSGDTKAAANTLSNLAMVYRDQGFYDKALEYYDRALKIKEKVGDVKGIGSIYYNLASCYQKLEQLDKAKLFYTRAIEQHEKLNDKYGLQLTYNKLGEVELETDAFDPAMKHFQLALKTANEIGNKAGTCRILANIGLLFIEQEEHKKAIDYLNQSLEIADAINMVIVQRDAHEGLAKAYAAKKKHKDAYHHQAQYTLLNDRIRNEENQKEVLRQEYQYQYEKKAREDSLATVEKMKVLELEREKYKRELEKRNTTPWQAPKGKMNARVKTMAALHNSEWIMNCDVEDGKLIVPNMQKGSAPVTSTTILSMEFIAVSDSTGNMFIKEYTYKLDRDLMKPTKVMDEPMQFKLVLEDTKVWITVMAADDLHEITFSGNKMTFTPKGEGKAEVFHNIEQWR